MDCFWRLVLAIYLASMADVHNEHKYFLVGNAREYPVVTYAVSPESSVASRWFSRGTGIVQVQVHEVALDSSRKRSVGFADVFVDRWRKAKPIGHGLGRAPVKVFDSERLLAGVNEGLQGVFREEIVFSIV